MPFGLLALSEKPSSPQGACRSCTVAWVFARGVCAKGSHGSLFCWVHGGALTVQAQAVILLPSQAKSENGCEPEE